MTELINQLKHEQKQCERSGSNGLAKLWGSAIEEIEQLQSQLAEMQQERDEALALTEEYKQGVFHFNRTHGDMNPLLTTLTNSPKEPLTQLKRDIAVKVVQNILDEGETGCSTYICAYIEQIKSGEVEL